MSTQHGPEGLGAAEPDCLFCRIVAGELPSRQVYADDEAVAFLDIAPFHRGHSLVVPRRHATDLLDHPGTLAAITPAVERTARLLVDRLGAAGVNILSSAGAIAGQEVFHLHVHVVPRFPDRPGIGALLVRDADATDDALDEVHRIVTGAAG